MRARRGLGAVVVLFVVAAAAPAGASHHSGHQPGDAKEVYTGTLVGVGGAAGGRTWPFTLTITDRTPDADLQRDLALLEDNGQDAFRRAVEKRKLGTFALAGQLGRDLNVVIETPTPDGRRITVVFERWERMFEVRNGTRSLDYPFTYVELSIDDAGKGSGMMIGLAKLYFDKKDPSVLTVENFGTYPVRLLGVNRRR